MNYPNSAVVLKTLKEMPELKEAYLSEFFFAMDLVEESGLRIHVSQQYEHCPLTFRMLTELSELFDTKNIDEVERYSTPGCDTCDYGSVYSWTLLIKPDKE